MAVDVDIGKLERGLRSLKRSFRLIDRGLIKPLFDDEQKLAVLDVRAFGKQPLLEEAVDAYTQIDFIPGFDPAREGRRRFDLRGTDLDDGHGRRWCGGRWIGLIVVAASGEEEDRAQSGPCRKGERPTHQTDLHNRDRLFVVAQQLR